MFFILILITLKKYLNFIKSVILFLKKIMKKRIKNSRYGFISKYD